MKKVLILSYFAPPCNLTPSNRIKGWLKNLPDLSYYPILVTRHWSGMEKNDIDRLKSTNTKMEIIQNGDSETHILPYLASYRDKSFIRSSESTFCSYLSKVLTFVNLFLQKVRVKSVPFYNLYFYTRDYLRKNEDVRILIISCNPFEQLLFGYLLKKEFPDLKWIPDYRDDWTGNELYDVGGGVYRWLNRLNRHFEKKWVSNASGIISVSKVYAERLSLLHKKDVHVVMNGFGIEVEVLKQEKIVKSSNQFIISYSGTVYLNQEFRTLFEGINKFARENSDLEVILQFIGAKGFHFGNRELIEDDEAYAFTMLFTDRLPWSEAYMELRKSNALCLTSYKNLKGIPTSKLFEYITTDVPIVLAPSDKDVIEEVLTITNTGLICNSGEDVFLSLEKIHSNSTFLEPNYSFIEKYSSSFQTKKLSNLLDKI